MGFTYDLTTAVGQVRLALGDTVPAAGVRPDGTNFTDAEVAFFLTQEVGNVDNAAARACAVLANAWANVADLSVGPRRESLSQVAARYAERATQIRGGSLTAGVISLAFAETYVEATT
jgi:hypothetical protein